jgi:hypothetical protein
MTSDHTLGLAASQRLVTSVSGLATKRPRNAAQTRADILSVAVALVIRYFGSKQDLFAPAAAI